MRIDPAIAAMGSRPDLQRRAQTVMRSLADGWRSEPDVAVLLDELDRFGAGDLLAACPGLHAALTRIDAASALVADWCRRFASALACNTLGQVPFRHGFDGRVSTLLLARSGRAHLVLHSIESGQQAFSTAGYSDGERHEIVLAGAARARIVRCPGFAEEPLSLEAGAGLALDLSHEALQVIEVDTRLVTLRLHRIAAAPGPNREYALAEGVLLRQSSGDIVASRREMAIALLGRMGCTDAVPTIAALACEPGDSALRWQALREGLALDSAAGFRALTYVAGNPGDPLAEAARALRADLVAAHPELSRAELSHVRGVSCPA